MDKKTVLLVGEMRKMSRIFIEGFEGGNNLVWNNLVQVSIEVDDPFPLDIDHIHAALCLKLSNEIEERYKGEIKEIPSNHHGRKRYTLQVWVGGESDLYKDMYPPIFQYDFPSHPKKEHDITEVNKVLGGIWGVLVKSGFDWATRAGILNKVKEGLNVKDEEVEK